MNATTDDGLQPTTTADSGGKAYKQFQNFFYLIHDIRLCPYQNYQSLYYTLDCLNYVPTECNEAGSCEEISGWDCKNPWVSPRLCGGKEIPGKVGDTCQDTCGMCRGKIMYISSTAVIILKLDINTLI